jgi:hypothetical protein
VVWEGGAARLLPIPISFHQEDAMSLVRLLVVLAMLTSHASYAIDKGFFSGLKPESAERVLMSFQSPLYFPSGERSGELVASINVPKPYASSTYEFVILMFLTRDDAAAYLRILMKTAPERLGYRGTNMNRIMVAQYKKLGQPNSNNRNEADFVIVDAFLQLMLVVQTIYDEKLQPYVYEYKGKRFIPSFLHEKDAIAFQEMLQTSGKGKMRRVGVDFRSHLKFVEGLIDSDAPVITFGEDFQKYMDNYVENIAK